MVTNAGGVRTTVRYGDSRLRNRCQPIRTGEEGVNQLADDIWQLLRNGGGVGLAAPQLGDLRRLVVVKDPRRAIPPRRLVLINPVVVFRSANRSSYEEGCLSFPGLYLHIVRPVAIRVRYEDLAGHRHELDAMGLLARIIQHEVDHLDGVLFIDHLSPVRRWFLTWRLRKLAACARKDVA